MCLDDGEVQRLESPKSANFGASRDVAGLAWTKR